MNSDDLIAQVGSRIRQDKKRWDAVLLAVGAALYARMKNAPEDEDAYEYAEAAGKGDSREKNGDGYRAV